jgi:hypothetical protein
MTAEMMIQRTPEWYRNRLGHITGSNIGKLMVSGRKKDEMFGKTAMSYIHEVAGERLLDPDMVADDERFAEWLERSHPMTRPMRWGVEQEPVARDLVSIRKSFNVAECGSYRDESGAFWSSPDGVVMSAEGDKVVIAVEIKTVGVKAALEYAQMQEPEDLKEINSDYYWQMMAEIAATGAEIGFFCVYCPDLEVDCRLQVLTVLPDEQAIASLRMRAVAANREIERIINRKLFVCNR